MFQYTDVADPEPGAGDVIVDVAATSLNRLDLVQRNGWFQMPGFSFRTSPGWTWPEPCLLWVQA